jgi:hypothetical protein
MRGQSSRSAEGALRQRRKPHQAEEEKEEDRQRCNADGPDCYERKREMKPNPNELDAHIEAEASGAVNWCEGETP